MNLRIPALAGVALALGLTVVLSLLLSLTASERAEAVISGDVNGDGTVNSIDASIILQFDAGLISSVPSKPTPVPNFAATPTPAPCTYSGPYSFSGSLPEIAQTTSTFCLTELRAILEWTNTSDDALLGIDLRDESANLVAHTSFRDTGSESIQTEGPGHYFLDIRLNVFVSTTEASWTLTISQ